MSVCTLDMACQFMREDKVPTELFLTHKWSFEQIPEAYEAVKNGDAIKGLVVIKG